jgi:hypothetical protein
LIITLAWTISVYDADADLLEETYTNILKYIMANFNVGKDAKTVNVHLKLSLRAGVKNKSLRQSKGTGASGSFKIGEVVKPKKKRRTI